MPRISLLVAALAALAAGPASASVFVAAGNYASACYDRARNNEASLAALDICTTALRIEPLSARDRAATLVNRGLLYRQFGRSERALADFQEAIRVEPALAEGHLNLGAALLERGQHAAAVEAISRGIERGPADPALAYYARGVAHEEAGDLRAAYRDYRQAAELAPHWSAPRHELARFQVR